MRVAIRSIWLGLLLVGPAPALTAGGRADAQPGAPPAEYAKVLALDGEVQCLRSGDDGWKNVYKDAELRPGDSVRTGPYARATLQWSDQSCVELGEYTHLRILPPRRPGQQNGFRFFRGLLYLFHRDKPSDLEIQAQAGMAAVRSTELNLEVREDGRMLVTVLEGDVAVVNEAGEVNVATGQQAVLEPGQRPILTAVLDMASVIQWTLYYPAVLDVEELDWSGGGAERVGDAIRLYREGNLLRALEVFPSLPAPRTASEGLLEAALLLSVGQVPAVEAILSEVEAGQGPGTRAFALADALRVLIAAAKGQPRTLARTPQLASEWLAESCSLQAQGRLREALMAARRAVEVSPRFGFGWARLAELEFSFANTGAAADALEVGLGLSPRNAEAVSLRGFLWAARGRISQAIACFNEALGLDSNLGNAWLGRGLCRLRRGQGEEGRRDLLVAAATEPNRAILRSYLGKAYAQVGDRSRATKELGLAKELDPQDPTAWFYEALLEQQNNEVNQAIRDLERSVERNDNRRIYRSGLLLDQDRSVRNANLASIYRDAGMFDVSVREAARAVNEDYGNYSAHLFLANSYWELHDPKLINLRYETPANAEYLLANLLAPAAAGTYSPALSAQDYGRLFERNRVGVVSSTEYYSSGDWVQSAAQYGVLGDFSYSAEVFYRTENGQRPNNDLEQLQISLTLKQQLSPQDTLYLQGSYADLSSGDLFQYYDQDWANPWVRLEESQEPILVAGYHREWQPGMHTLLMGIWLNDSLAFDNPVQPTLTVFQTAGRTVGVHGFEMHLDFEGEVNVYGGELQQIWQTERHNTLVGARIQAGSFDTRSLQDRPTGDQALFPTNAPAAWFDDAVDLGRVTVYGYHHWQILDVLQLIGGLTYDWLQYPENFRYPPLSDQEEDTDQLSPKIGFLASPAVGMTWRGSWTRSLSGASLDQSYQLEPPQLAGFVQSYRSVIPESVAGANAGARIEAFDLAIEQQLPTGTYLGIHGQALESEVNRTVGAFSRAVPNAVPMGVREALDYGERSLSLTVHQLIGQEWSLGASYEVAEANLCDDFPELGEAPIFVNFQPHREVRSTLQQARLYTAFNHASGAFGRFESLWRHQSHQGDAAGLPSEGFWQFNLYAGYRLPGRRAELLVGLLNLTDEDYQLNPLNLYAELPRERTLVTRLQFRF